MHVRCDSEATRRDTDRTKLVLLPAQRLPRGPDRLQRRVSPRGPLLHYAPRQGRAKRRDHLHPHVLIPQVGVLAARAPLENAR